MIETSNSPEGIVIQIGPIILQGFEIPQSIRFGGRQRLAVHKLSGGRRLVERLGPDDGEVSFGGTFSGPNAEARVRAFDNLRLSGEVVWLTWESFRRRVVVKDFTAEFSSPWWIPYQISCVVTYQSGVISPRFASASALVALDLAAAAAALAGSAISITSLQSAFSLSNALTAGTSSNAQAAGAVGDILATIGSQIDTQSAVVGVLLRRAEAPPTFVSRSTQM